MRQRWYYALITALAVGLGVGSLGRSPIPAQVTPLDQPNAAISRRYDTTPDAATPSQAPHLHRIAALETASLSESTEQRRLPMATSAAPPQPSVRDFIDRGDPRTPPLAPAIEEELPTSAELADAESYHGYETRQQTGTVLAFAQAAVTALEQMRHDIDLARRVGATPEQLNEAEDKRRHLEAVLQRVDRRTGELH